MPTAGRRCRTPTTLRRARGVQDVLQPPRAGANSAAARSTATPRIAGPTQNSKGVITECCRGLLACVVRHPGGEQEMIARPGGKLASRMPRQRGFQTATRVVGFGARQKCEENARGVVTPARVANQAEIPMSEGRRPEVLQPDQRESPNLSRKTTSRFTSQTLTIRGLNLCGDGHPPRHRGDGDGRWGRRCRTQLPDEGGGQHVDRRSQLVRAAEPAP